MNFIHHGITLKFYHGMPRNTIKRTLLSFFTKSTALHKGRCFFRRYQKQYYRNMTGITQTCLFQSAAVRQIQTINRMTLTFHLIPATLHVSYDYCVAHTQNFADFIQFQRVYNTVYIFFRENFTGRSSRTDAADLRRFLLYKKRGAFVGAISIHFVTGNRKIRVQET